jgi:hypothetical protein
MVKLYMFLLFPWFYNICILEFMCSKQEHKCSPTSKISSSCVLSWAIKGTHIIVRITSTYCNKYNKYETIRKWVYDVHILVICVECLLNSYIQYRWIWYVAQANLKTSTCGCQLSANIIFMWHNVVKELRAMWCHMEERMNCK